MADREPPCFLLGLIGSSIQQSRTPHMHMCEGDAQGLRVLYQKIDLDQLETATPVLPRLIESAALTGFRGLNITHPCKQEILPLLDCLSEEAMAIGAVNTVVFHEGQTTGYNTDCSGFMAAFRAGLPAADMRVVVQLGAGGAGTAVAHALLALNTRELVIFDRERVRSQTLAQQLSRRYPHAVVRSGTDLDEEMQRASGLTHCTPTGMAKHPGLPLPAQLLRPALWVAEIVYFPLETALLQKARQAGCRTLNGAGMAVWQAVDAFRLFTGREPDVRRMTRQFEALGT